MVTMVILSTLGWAINSPCDVMICYYHDYDYGKKRKVTMVTIVKQDMLPW